MAQLNYKQELIKLENNIADITFAENKEILELMAANLNSLYGLISVLHGLNDYVFPITTVERSKKFLVMLYTISAFQISSSILDLALSGEYPEAAILMRSLIESVGFAEYYYLNPPSPKLITTDIAKLPTRQSVFKYLSKYGKWPQGGPQKTFKRYNNAAHADIVSVLIHWAEAQGRPQTTYIWLRKYNRESFYNLTRDMVIPLIGIKQVFRDTFVKEIENKEDKSWAQYWKVGHNREKINHLFPEIHLGDS